MGGGWAFNHWWRPRLKFWLVVGRTRSQACNGQHASAHFSRKYEWTGKGGGRGEGVGGEGGLSPYFNSSLKRVLAAKHLPCSSATAIHNYYPSPASSLKHLPTSFIALPANPTYFSRWSSSEGVHWSISMLTVNKISMHIEKHAVFRDRFGGKKPAPFLERVTLIENAGATLRSFQDASQHTPPGSATRGTSDSRSICWKRGGG